MNPHDRQSQPPESPMPQGMQRDLRALYGQTPAVPAEVDARIAALAAEALARAAGHSRRRARRWAWGAGSAVAAAIALATWLALQPAAYHRQGTILDAFYLARQIRSGAHLNMQWDINGDGKVDSRDVDALAASAVELKHAQPMTLAQGGL